jgi:hypothetical protein
MLSRKHQSTIRVTRKYEIGLDTIEAIFKNLSCVFVLLVSPKDLWKLVDYYQIYIEVLAATNIYDSHVRYNEHVLTIK